MIHNYNDWLNENLPNDKYFRTCLDTVIYLCLRSFSPVDGNPIENDRIVELAVSMNPDLFYSDSPDFWVNCGDFDGKFDAEVEEVEAYFAKNHKLVDDEFKKYGIEVSTLQVGEVIVSLYLPYHVRTTDPEYLRANAEFVVKFYDETQPEGLKSLERGLGSHLTGKEYGI